MKTSKWWMLGEMLAVAILVFAMFPALVQGGNKWVEYGDNPIFGEGAGGTKAYYPSVLYDTDGFSGHGGSAKYKMWYGTSGSQTALATSDDGIDWTNQGVVMTNGYHATVEYFPAGFAGVNSGGNPNGSTMNYRMWYWDPSHLYEVAAIGYTESPNGVNWYNDQPCQNGAVPIVSGAPSWNRGSYGPCDVIYNPDASNTGTDWSYTMYYDGTTGGTESIGLGFSSDGITWTGFDPDGNSEADPVLSGTYVAGNWDYNYVSRATIIQKADGGYEIWYSGGDGTMNQGIGYALSPDGKYWVRDDDNPLLYKDDGVPWRRERTYCPMVVFDPVEGIYKMWFAGKDASGNYSIGYAVGGPQPTVVWVDDDWASAKPAVAVIPGRYFGYNAFATVQDGVDNVGDSTVNVAAGTYDGAIIDKDATVQGDPAGGTAINDGVHYGGGHPTLETGFLLDVGADGTSVGDFVFNCDQSSNYYFAVFSRGIDNITLANLLVNDAVQGLTNWGGSGWFIVDNDIIDTIASGGGGIGIWLGAIPVSYPTLSNNRIINNLIKSEATAPDYTCPGIGIGLDLRYGAHSSMTGAEDLSGNWIIGNTILGTGNENEAGIEMGVITTGIDPAELPGVLAASLGLVHDNVIALNTIDGSDLGLYLYTVLNTDVNRNIIANCVSAGVHMEDGTLGNVFRYNSITGNAVGFENMTGVDVDAALNWWGDVDGPSGEGTGAGDSVSANVIFSPWLGIDPDGNLAAPGVQITGPMTIIVAPVGPEPASGYLNAAITGANSPELPFTDTIEVQHGAYDASTPITQPANILSETGSALHTTLNGNVSINGNGVLIGLPLQGFRMNGNVTVGAGANAATSRINWCDFYGLMTNNGTGTFDAQYNYWGTQEVAVVDGRTTGLIDYDPFLPKNADDSYVDATAIIAAGLAAGIDPAIDQLWLMVQLGQDVNTFIQYQGVAGAGAFGGAPMGAEINLGGAAGGGGAVEGAISGTYTLGEPIDGRFTLTDPVTGEPITDAAVTTSLLGPDGALVFWGCAIYDETTGEYVFTIDTSGLAPGTYELIIQTDDGQSKTVSIEVLAA